MGNKIIIDYDKLPQDFFENMIYFEHTRPTGLLDVDDCLRMISNEGKVYYMYHKEFREGDYDRLIPFIRTMVEADITKTRRWICYSNPPEGWSFYYHFHKECIIQKEIYMKFQMLIPEIDTIDRENIIEKYDFWKEQLYRIMEEHYHMEIEKELEHYIRVNELLHVYGGKHNQEYVEMQDLADISKSFMDKIAIIDVDYSWGKGWKSGIRFELLTENEPGYWSECSFENGDSKYLTEENFAKYFSCLASINFNDLEQHFEFNMAPKGYIYYSYRHSEGDLQFCWIKEELYWKNYVQIIKPLLLLGSKRPYCKCLERD